MKKNERGNSKYGLGTEGWKKGLIFNCVGVHRQFLKNDFDLPICFFLRSMVDKMGRRRRPRDDLQPL